MVPYDTSINALAQLNGPSLLNYIGFKNFHVTQWHFFFFFLQFSVTSLYRKGPFAPQPLQIAYMKRFACTYTWQICPLCSFISDLWIFYRFFDIMTFLLNILPWLLLETTTDIKMMTKWSVDVMCKSFAHWTFCIEVCFTNLSLCDTFLVSQCDIYKHYTLWLKKTVTQSYVGCICGQNLPLLRSFS